MKTHLDTDPTRRSDRGSVGQGGTEGLEVATSAALGSGGPCAAAGAAAPYLVSVHRVLLLQLALAHRLVLLLIFLQLLGRHLQGQRRSSQSRRRCRKHFPRCFLAKSLAF